jgi:8-oxo-dGTP pyrophosphatase MutT (NUDIX family)
MQMDLELLNRLLQALPLYSEEDDLREEVTESDLRIQLAGEGGAGILMCVRRIFEAFTLLDQRLLAEDKWAFVSFPASLFGHSLLQTLATPGQQIFNSDYWRSVQSADIEEQRTLLKQLETKRVRLHPTGSASPIRFVFVAWGLIRLGGKFLLHHREDRHRADIKNYVLPGGRFKPGDLPPELQVPRTLRQIHLTESRLAIDALEQTLVRELNEELGLHIGEDWHPTKRVILNPYRRVEGSENKHSFTEYVLALYDISLTPEGEARLLDRIAHSSGGLVWFSVADLVDPIGRSDGRRAFIDALSQQFGNRLHEFLSGTPSSSTILYRFSTRTEAVELPAIHDDPVLIGETGKEKPKPIELSDEGHALLLLLGAHGKGLKLVPEPAHLSFLPGGWVKAESQMALAELAHLQSQLTAEGLSLLQQVGEHFVRVSVDPEFLFFGERLFSYRLLAKDDSRGDVELKLKLPASPWSGAISWSLSILVAPNMLRSLVAIESGIVGPGDLERFGYSDETMKKNCKEMLDEKFRALGLRKLVRRSGKLYQICVSCMTG